MRRARAAAAGRGGQRRDDELFKRKVREASLALHLLPLDLCVASLLEVKPFGDGRALAGRVGAGVERCGAAAIWILAVTLLHRSLHL